MKEFYIASIIHNGVLGGVLYLTDTMTVYRTNKLTVDKKYRNLEISYQEIREVKKGWAFIFPKITILLNDNTIYNFIVFSRNKYYRRIQKFINSCS